MKKIQFKLLVAWACALGSAGTLLAQTNVEQWDFTSGNLAATVGSDLQYADGFGGLTDTSTKFNSTSGLGIPDINGTNAQVMMFPANTNGMGYFMPVTPDANGGGFQVNDYTLIMDVFYPASSGNSVRPLLQTYALGGTVQYIVINSSGAIGPAVDGGGGVNGPFVGSIKSDTWCRLGLSVTAGNTVTVFTNGVEMGSFPADVQDGYFAMTPYSLALILGTTSTTAAPGYVNSIQFRDVALNAGQMKALGGPEAAGIPQTIPPVPSFVDSRTPDVGATAIAPTPDINVVLNQGDTTVDGNSIKLYMDGNLLPATITPSAPTFTIDYADTNILRPLSTHNLDLVYSDSVLGLQTNSWSFTVCNFQNITLPAPIYSENFDEVAEGAWPTGWSVTNNTVPQTPGFDLGDPTSDAYLSFVVISSNRVLSVFTDTETFTSPGFPPVTGERRLVHPPIELNGQLLDSLVHTNVAYCDSDQRQNTGGQVDVMFSPDYDLTGKTNIYLAFFSTYEQNQDNIGSVEYSIDQGQTWLPALYLLDDGTTDGDGSDVVYNNGQIDVFATFGTPRSDQAYGLAYSNFIGAVVSTNLIPYIQGRRNDDPISSKRIEVIRLPYADNQAHVRFRFGQAGTSSWYFGIDNFGLYSINTPVVGTVASQTIEAGTPVTLSVSVSGAGPFTYQWEHGGKTLQGQTNSTLSINSVSSSDAGAYDVIVANADGPTTSGVGQLTVITTPQFVSQPISQVSYVNSSVTFSASVLGGRPMSQQWNFNGAPIPGANTNSLTLTGLMATNTGDYTLVLSNSFGTNMSAVAHLTVYSGAITNGLVAHLKFDGDYSDASGDGTAGSAVGSPTFETGILGQAVHVISTGTPANGPSTNNYVTLGTPTQLQFGTNDFSISFWAKINSQNDDKPFVSNKDWGSGGNLGWVLATEGGGMKWNFTDDLSGRRDSSTVAPQLKDGNWHNVVVTFIRSSIGSIFVDGLLVNTTSVAPNAGNAIGTADSGLPINIGQDGTGHYTDGGGGAAVDMLVDDVGIWNRAIAPTEAASIYVQGEQGGDLTTASGAPVVLKATIAANPVSQVVSPGANVLLSVQAGGTAPFTFQWEKNGTPVGGSSSNLTLTAVTTNDMGGYYAIVSNAGGSVTSLVAQVTVFTGPITQNLVAHLKFDGDYTDASGNGSAGSAVGTPTFETGILGQAVHVNSAGTPQDNPAPNNYVTLGSPSQLKFGTNDFSISFWTKVNSQNDDKPFIANKDWGSGSNPGWALASEGSGMKWNFRDDQNGRHDSSTVAPQLEDGNWHNVVVTFLRSSVGSIYVDGQLMTSGTIAPDAGKPVGSVDTAYGISIGQDGTGLYTDGDGGASLDALVDDLGIWRRVITPTEAASIYTQGEKGQDLTTASGVIASTPGLQITNSGGTLTITWTGATGMVLQEATSLESGNWTDVPGTDGASSYSPPATNGAAFFRLNQ